MVGTLEFDYHMLTVPARPDRSLITYLPQPGSPTAEALKMLLSWVADQTGLELPTATAEPEGDASSTTA